MAEPTPNRDPATPRSGRLVVDDDGNAVDWVMHGGGPRTLLTLHGGPGMGHTYLDSLARLAGPDRAVVLFDQLGSGTSDCPAGPDAYGVERSIAEVEAVRTGLDLGAVDLYGHSWGGWLALSYALAHPAAVRSLVLSGTSASVAEYLLRVQTLRTALGTDKFRILQRHEATGDFDHPDYQRVIRELSARHLRRAWPFTVERSESEIDDLIATGMLAFGPAYGHLWGPNEFACTGPLLDWDVTADLHRIAAPTLILCGRHDEVTVECSATLAEAIPDNEFVVFGNSSHMTMLERESELYLAVIANFLSRADARTATAPGEFPSGR